MLTVEEVAAIPLFSALPVPIWSASLGRRPISNSPPESLRSTKVERARSLWLSPARSKS